MNKKLLAIGMMAILGTTAGMTAQAAMLQTGDLLTLKAGVPVYDSYGNFVNVSSGSYFDNDISGTFKIKGPEKAPITPGSDGGIRIGLTQAPGAIDVEPYFGFPSEHYTTAPVTGGTTSGLNFSGWAMYWLGGFSTPLNSGAWTPLNCASQGIPCSGYSNGVALFSWSGIYGDTYTLNYTARIPLNDPSGFGNISYFLHLEGTVTSAVPVPAAVWLFGSGLLGLVGVSGKRRR